VLFIGISSFSGIVGVFVLGDISVRGIFFRLEELISLAHQPVTTDPIKTPIEIIAIMQYLEIIVFAPLLFLS